MQCIHYGFCAPIFSSSAGERETHRQTGLRGGGGGGGEVSGTDRVTEQSPGGGCRQKRSGWWMQTEEKSR